MELSPLLQLGCLLLSLACLVWSGYLHFWMHQIRQEFDAAVPVEEQVKLCHQFPSNTKQNSNVENSLGGL